MKPYMLIAFLSVAAFLIYGLNRGIYVGMERYIVGAPCCPDLDVIQKKCRYLFVTGISEINARDGEVKAPNVRENLAALKAALEKPENGYCRLFAE